MKPIMIIGIVLIGLGILGVVYKGIPYQTKEKVIDIGPIQATETKDKSLPISPLFSIAALVGGTALVIAGSRKRV